MHACVCLSVCHHLCVWLGLFMCILILYLGFTGTSDLVVLYACVLYLHLFSANEHASHGKAL